MDKSTKNETIFRAANEQLKTRLGELELNGRIPFVCECGDMDCLQAVELTTDEYEEARRGDLFFMIAGHEDLATEKVVGGENGYILTEKLAHGG